MSEKKPYDSILLRDGTSTKQQKETVLLKKGYFKPDERRIEDVYNFAKAFASKINFYQFESFENSSVSSNVNIEDCKDGNWSSFFDDITNISIENKNDFDPHLALYFAFLKLFANSQNHINQFTQRHLDFYYKNVLNIHPAKGLEDNAFVIFELAKNANEVLVEKGTLLDSGKINNRPANYTIVEDVVVNKAVVDRISTIYISGVKKDIVNFAQKTDTIDGVSKALKTTAPHFDAFGLRHIEGAQMLKAKPGFAIASSILLLKEGTRNLTVTIQLSNVSYDLSTAQLSNEVELFFTGKKNWLGAFKTKALFKNFKNSAQTLEIKYQLASTEEAIVAYNPLVHKGSYETNSPIMQVLIDTTRPGNLFSILRNLVVQSIAISVDVVGVSDLQIENDSGVLDAKKPFLPFGPSPKKRSSFYISYNELFQKNITGYEFQIEWLGAPQNFVDYYKEYGSGNSNSSFSANYTSIDGADGTTLLFNTEDASKNTSWPSGTFKFVAIGSLFMSSVIKYNSFYNLNSNPNYSTVINQSLNIKNIAAVAKPIVTPPFKGFIKLDLNRTFLHEKYGNVFSNKAIEKSKASDPSTVNLPNEPYTPTIKSISLNYKATLSAQRLDNTTFDEYNKKQVQLFHIGVFGHSEQHGYLKEFVQSECGSKSTIDRTIFLLPHLSTASFYIGLKDISSGQTVSILFQLAEESADPDAPPEKVEWHVLCSNEWRLLGNQEILKNETNNFLQSGIIRFVIPDGATNDNTILEAGFIWLRASVSTNTNSVCLFERIVAQAARASYQRPLEGNDAGAIAAGTITKLVNKKPSIKQLLQPFASFGGKYEENDLTFNIRVSERLRHKGRGVMNWDLEHIVLQAFPQIYKVKCLNHFNNEDDCCKEHSPGYITLVVVPNIAGKNFYDPLRPKVNTNIRQQIKAHLQSYISFFTTLYVVNPDYETLLLDFNVRFISIGDFGLYRDKLNTAICNYLTPWAFNDITEVHFGGRVSKSALLNFIEEQEYVDFVTNLKMFHIDEHGKRSGDINTAIITNPKAILVSATQHNIQEHKDEDICK